jgi:hypothetical protein
MVGHELAIEQLKAPDLHPRHQPYERHLRRIGYAAEHAFAEKRPPHCHPVKSADQLAVQPAFDAMCVASALEFTKCVLDVGVYPGIAPVIARFRAGCDNTGKRLVCCHHKPFLPDGLRQRFRQDEPLQRQYRPLFGLDPECIRVIARIGHRKNAIGISAHQQIQINRQRRSFLLPSYLELRPRMQWIIAR